MTKLIRYLSASEEAPTLEKFVEQEDINAFANSSSGFGETSATIYNSFPTLAAFHEHLNGLDLLNQDRLRPSWDTYFMVCSPVPLFLSLLTSVAQRNLPI